MLLPVFLRFFQLALVASFIADSLDDDRSGPR
jgi:hypothetical protein